ncbi:MAG: alpha/beta hydrolase [Oscillospiraceae bacterium]|nr:alpha/beta hydrolase [Oscillospiraceae bacterium]
MNEFFVKSCDGVHSLRVREYIPEGEIKAAVQLAHSIAEHIERYDEFARFLCSKGIMFRANDHLGHGGSVSGDDEVGFFAEKDGWKTVVSDMHALVKKHKSERGDIPLFLMGHSMGSFLTRCYASLHPKEDIAGYILSGTGHISRFISGAGAIMCEREIKKNGPKARSQTLKKLCFGGYNKKFEGRTASDWLTRDEKIVDAYEADPLCGFDATNALYRDLMGMIRFVTDVKNVRLMDKTKPIMLVSGDMDPVGGYGKEVAAYHKLLHSEGFEDICMILYENARHEILNELQKADVMDDIAEWIQGRI